MPYNAPLTQRLIVVYQQGYVLAGQPASARRGSWPCPWV
jgi:hypothetical protein